MGYIVTKHNVPGVYTKTTPHISNKSITKTKNTSDKANTIYNGAGSDNINRTIYYGYYPVITIDGKKTETTYSQLKNITQEIIINNFKKDYITSDSLQLNGGENIVIRTEIFGVPYNEYLEKANEYNKCFVLCMTKKLYYECNMNLLTCKVPDSTTNITSYFDIIKTIFIGETQFIVLALFGEKFEYSPVNCDKIISPIIIKSKL